MRDVHFFFSGFCWSRLCENCPVRGPEARAKSAHGTRWQHGAVVGAWALSPLLCLRKFDGL